MFGLFKKDDQKKSLRQQLESFMPMLGMVGFKPDAVIKDVAKQLQALEEEYQQKIIVMLFLMNDGEGFELQFHTINKSNALELLHLELITDFNSALDQFDSLPEKIKNLLQNYVSDSSEQRAKEIAANTAAEGAASPTEPSSPGREPLDESDAE